ncbi:pyridoxal phosphate-dependent aminotransferase [Ensifer adhaerens]|uniref:pyridoxal phosphate-dependent aminotransferase n=1 Tax=Ensifer adhaerens TaxID=106592 RepID=UPI001CBF7571|nr:pyridoxal phosphate-dependent aminotransferase [Ensifer adhaerens]MBZ7920351.1 pyridoxal phosphate-dependent aminotransferase [Ensifer adhaerens]UAX92837.1 pyridoxal phosphate-dependent aminotransferase [Ensifer adhaerens]UAY00472.1 pyridoxal phosphate-dependent aminotransferase [Ensifer adhaerens]UAY07855.1 pyridoxal phosphate-dependent aminotransferase [Ensifer adhaerens]
MTILSTISPRALAAPESGIVEVVNYARGRDGLIPLWVGEGDLPTPAFISDAAREALVAGETFYTWQRGIPPLREALARYYQRRFQKSLSPENFYVVGSGMQAIKLSIEAIASPGDEMVLLTPAWPNFAAAADLSGVRPVSVELRFEHGKWQLDLDRLEAAIGPKTRALFINTPSNPTGWTATREELAAILALARKHGLWIIADEIYALYYYAGTRAPSFLDVMEEGDRILFVNSFSKNWSMTGWRVGWIVAPPEMGQVLENLVQYSTSGVAQFMQRGAVVALDEGDAFLDANVAKATKNRDVFCDALIATNRVETLKPDGALYAFLKIDGVTDSRAAAIDIVDKTGVGLAPGTAFGDGGSLFMRACFLRDPAQVKEAADRLQRYILGG